MRNNTPHLRLTAVLYSDGSRDDNSNTREKCYVHCLLVIIIYRSIMIKMKIRSIYIEAIASRTRGGVEKVFALGSRKIYRRHLRGARSRFLAEMR